MDFLTYKGKPLVRKGKEIYYGDMAEKYIIKFDVLSEKEENGQKLPGLAGNSVRFLKIDGQACFRLLRYCPGGTCLYFLNTRVKFCAEENPHLKPISLIDKSVVDRYIIARRMRISLT